MCTYMPVSFLNTIHLTFSDRVSHGLGWLASTSQRSAYLPSTGVCRHTGLMRVLGIELGSLYLPLTQPKH